MDIELKEIALKSTLKITTKRPAHAPDVGNKSQNHLTTNKMFKTVYSVQRTHDENTQYTVYFESYTEAKAFVLREAYKTGKAFEHGKKVYLDGSFAETWTSKQIDPDVCFEITDFAWVTDYTGLIMFHDIQGLAHNFETQEEFNNYIKQSKPQTL